MNQKKNLEGIDFVDSSLKAIEVLENLDRKLAEVGLNNVRIFNKTYLVISKNLEKETDLFKDKKTLERLDVHFANAYFNALNKYRSGKVTSPAWEIFFDFCVKNKSSNIFYLWLGANAHINNDLPFSLKQIVSNEFYHDYKRVQSIIDKSIEEILPNITRNKVKQKTYLLIIKFICRRWRTNAWVNYKILTNDKKYFKAIEKKAKITKRFLSLVTVKYDLLLLFRVFRTIV